MVPDSVTPEEARAWFPVLDRIAYLNAGTFGPISRATQEAMLADLARDFEEGRSGNPYFHSRLELRDAKVFSSDKD